MIVALLDAVLSVEVGRKETRRMDHVQKPIRLRDAQLYRHQSPRKKEFRFRFRDRKEARMAGRDQ